ncbi:MAG TPA: DUF3035 domain-containing protein [Rhizomicrobium sp.]
MMHDRMGIASRLLALGGLALLLVGCESIREAAGITKEPPDEFAVVTKAPLVIPPEFNLRPPKPGASPTNQISPTAAAQIALYGDDPNAIAAGLTGNYSQEEKLVMAQTGAATSDHAVRQQIEADNKKMEASDPSFTEKVLFQSPEPDQGKAVDANAEAERIAQAKAQGKTVTPSSGAPAAQQPNEKKPDDAPTIQKDDSGGWLDGILGGIF